MNRTLYQYLLGASPILLLPMACGGTVEVGKAKGDTENQPTDTSSTLGSGGGSSTDGSSNDEGGTAGEGPVPNCDAEADAAAGVGSRSGRAGDSEGTGWPAVAASASLRAVASTSSRAVVSGAGSSWATVGRSGRVGRTGRAGRSAAHHLAGP